MYANKYDGSRIVLRRAIELYKFWPISLKTSTCSHLLLTQLLTTKQPTIEPQLHNGMEVNPNNHRLIHQGGRALRFWTCIWNPQNFANGIGRKNGILFQQQLSHLTYFIHMLNGRFLLKSVDPTSCQQPINVYKHQKPLLCLPQSTIDIYGVHDCKLRPVGRRPQRHHDRHLSTVICY